MAEKIIDGVSYLGGHNSSPTQCAVEGRLRISAESLTFEVFGEYLETLFALQWSEFDGWETSGSNAISQRTSAAGVLVGAVLAGLPGALLGSLAKSREYQATLVCAAGTNRIAFAISSMPPSTVEAILRSIPGAAAVAGTRSVDAIAWDYEICDVGELGPFGQQGWEAVGVWVETTPRVLLKRRAK